MYAPLRFQIAWGRWNLLEGQGFSLDDLKRRLRLMWKLGALKVEGHRHSFTTLGLSFTLEHTNQVSKRGQSGKVVADDSFDAIDYVDSFGVIDFRDI